MTRPTQHPASNSTARKAETERRANLTVVPCCDAAAKVERVRELVETPFLCATAAEDVMHEAVPKELLRAALDGPTAGGAA